MSKLTIPCPHCTDGFVTAGDRHARTRQDVCQHCAGTGYAPAETGLPAETSAPAAPAEDVALSYSGNPMPPEGVEGCVYCGEPFKEGDMVLPEEDGGMGHVACAGPGPDGFVGADGEPLKDGDPIPTGSPWAPPAALARFVAGEPGDAAGEGLSLAVLHAANIARQNEWCPDQHPDLSFRGNELAGETGEACNVIKKLERERQGWRGSRATLNDLAEELADVVICADLCAVTAGIDLSAAVIAKFNATSKKVGISVMLPTPAALVDEEAGS